MDSSDDELSSKQKEFVEFLEKASNKGSFEKEERFIDQKTEAFHLNSLITKNISLFTKDPNYKLFTWLMVQILIFSLFVLTVTFMKNNIIPYLNSI